ncbi:hypothetical protein CR513_05154, partial [Mucuna pruriens]
MGLPLPPQTFTGETPYRLTFRTDAMILVKIGEPSLRRSTFDPVKNSSSLRTNLNLVEEAKEQTCIKASLNNRHLLFPSTTLARFHRAPLGPLESERGNAQTPKSARFRRAPLGPLGIERGNTQAPKGVCFRRAPLEPLRSERKKLPGT